MLAQVLRDGFAQTHRRPGLILLDIVWKLIWLASTLVGLLAVAYQFVSHFQWQSSSIRAVDALVIANLLRQLWNEYGGELLGGLIAVMGLSACAYLVLEATFRRRLVVAGFSPRPDPERGLKPATTSLTIFIGSRLARWALLTASVFFVGVVAYASPYARVAGLVTLVAFSFLLTVIDTLIRTGAVDLLGTDLMGVAGLIGTLLLFESFIGGSLVIAVIFGFLNVSSASEALAMLAVTTLVLFILNILHSYLLVVRFSAVAIMKRNVIHV